MSLNVVEFVTGVLVGGAIFFGLILFAGSACVIVVPRRTSHILLPIFGLAMFFGGFIYLLYRLYVVDSDIWFGLGTYASALLGLIAMLNLFMGADYRW